MSYAHGTNQKPLKDGPVDIHAETTVIQTCEALPNKAINALALVSDVQADDTTGFAPGVLLPCYRLCLPALERSPYITPQTLFLSGNRDLTRVATYDIAGARLAYEKQTLDPLHIVTFESPHAMDIMEWNEKLLGPLGQRALSSLTS